MASKNSPDPTSSSSETRGLGRQFERQLRQEKRKEEKELDRLREERRADAQKHKSRLTANISDDEDTSDTEGGQLNHTSQGSNPQPVDATTTEPKSERLGALIPYHDNGDSLYDVTPPPSVQDSGDSGDNENKPAESHMEYLEHEIHAVQAKQEELQHEVDKQRDEIRALRKQLREAEDRRLDGEADAKVRIDDLRSMLKECQMERDNLENQLEEAREREHELKRQLNQAKFEIDSQKHNFALLQTRSERSSRAAELEVMQHAQAATTLQHQLNTAQQHTTQQEDEIMRLRNENMELRRWEREPQASRRPSVTVRRNLRNGRFIRIRGEEPVLVRPTTIQSLVHS
jgi:predicted  nucleic acid-binding Zn-ribbon protein